MRSAIVAAAFAATAIAVPLQERDVVTATRYDVAYVTEYYTVTADGAAHNAAPTKEADTNPVPHHNNFHYGHHQPHWWDGPHTVPDKGHTKESSEPEPTQDPPHTMYTPPAHSPAQPTTPAEPTNTGWGEPEPTKEPKPTKSASPNPPSSPPASDYQGTVLHHHNIHRSNHSAPAVAWSASLAATAQKIADSCVYAHNTDMDGGGYGQNIAAGVSPDQVDRVITNMFYDSEINDYAASSNNYQSSSPSNFESWGHFSQVVWANTREVACVTKDCTGQGLANVGGNVPGYFTVCNYGPPGNVAGNYADNVHAPKGDPPVYV